MTKNFFYVFLISILPIIELRGAIPVGAALGLEPIPNAIAAIIGNLLPVPFILFFIPKILDLLERVRFFAPVVRWVRRKADKHSGKILGSQPTSAPEQGSLTDAAPSAVVADGTEQTVTCTEDAVTCTEDAAACTEDAAALTQASTSPISKDTVTPTDAVTPTDGAARKKRRKGGMTAVFWGLLLFVMIPCPGTGAWTGSLVASLFNLPKKLSFPAVLIGVLGCAVIMSLASYGVLEFLSFLL